MIFTRKSPYYLTLASYFTQISITHLILQIDAKFSLIASRVHSLPASMKDFQKNMGHILKTSLKENYKMVFE